MLVKNWMSSPVITIDINDSMQNAVKLLKQNDIGMLPVLKRGELVGIVTDRDLKRASASDATTLEIHELIYLLQKIKVEDIMTKNPITVPLDYTVEETTDVLLKNKISGVPVVDEQGVLRGAITKGDLFKVLLSLTGVGNKGIQFAFELEDRPGSIKEVADIIRKHGGRMVSILSSSEKVQEGNRRVYIRMFGIERAKLEELKGELKRNATLLYMIDHEQNKREIYSK